MELLKRIAAELPPSAQHALRGAVCRARIRLGRFRSTEPEWALLPTLVGSGDWAVDIGANVGHYAARLSELVGPGGRVLAFEPVAETFAILAENARLFAHPNVSLLNVAASNAPGVGAMEIPRWDTGLPNWYRARIRDGPSGRQVLLLPLDALALPHRVSLVKVDVEGHDLPALRGMTRILERDRPILIVENGSPEVVSFLEPFGYRIERLPGSPNALFRHAAR